jgi:hypothetical protein
LEGDGKMGNYALPDREKRTPYHTLQLPTLAGFVWDTSQLYIDDTLCVDAANLPGDFNNDGFVDAADYIVWRNGLVPSTPANYNTWRNNFGEPSGGGAASTLDSTVPEPPTLVMLIVAATGWCVRRRHAPEKVPSSR